jgi:AsmA protein
MKKVIVVLGVLLGLLVLAGIAVVTLVDVNAHKPRIESAVSDSLGMEFKILGKARLRLIPSAAIALSDIRLRNRGTDLATAGTLRVGVQLFPLLSRRVAITDLVLENPVIRVEKGADGKFNYETPPRPEKPPKEADGGPGSSLSVASGAVKNGSLVFTDRVTGEKTEIAGVEISVRGLSLPTDPGMPLTKGIRFAGELRMKEVKAGTLSVRDVDAKVTASAGVYDIRPITMTLFGGKGEGGIRADLSKKTPALSVEYTLSHFRAEESLAAAAKKKYLSGPLSVSPSITFHGTGAAQMKRTLNGTVSLRGEKLTVHGLDIDGVMSSVAQARRMNLADVGAFLLAGPLGTAVTKGYRFGGIYGSAVRSGDSEVTKLVSDWTVRDGIAQARDVAFATRRNRIALNGKLDLVNERFVDVTVAVLDPKGCATLRQRITGPFRDPQVDKVSALESAAAPILGLFEEARKMLQRSECEPFYTGSVPHPR